MLYNTSSHWESQAVWVWVVAAIVKWWYIMLSQCQRLPGHMEPGAVWGVRGTCHIMLIQGQSILICVKVTGVRKRSLAGKTCTPTRCLSRYLKGKGSVYVKSSCKRRRFFRLCVALSRVHVVLHLLNKQSDAGQIEQISMLRSLWYHSHVRGYSPICDTFNEACVMSACLRCHIQFHWYKNVQILRGTIGGMEWMRQNHRPVYTDQFTYNLSILCKKP